MKIVYLRPRSSYRTALQSDTLFGLICWGIKTLHGSKGAFDKLITSLKSDNEPPFVISSAFPCRFFPDENGKVVEPLRYYPRPSARPLQKKLDAPMMDILKDYKKLQMLPETLFERLRSGKMTEADLFEEFGEIYKINKKIDQWTLEEFNKEVTARNLGHWQYYRPPQTKPHTVMHNTIDRMTGSSRSSGGLFYTEEVFLRKDQHGLFFLVEFFDDDFIEIFQQLGRFYEHLGFGGDASTGKGVFEFSLEDFPHDTSIQGAQAVTNLSLYYPRPEELQYYCTAENKEKLWYKLQMRKGRVGGRLFVTPNVWKKSVNVFAEGGCFPKEEAREIYGTAPVVKQVSEDHPVYYNGFALMLDYNLKEAN